MNGIEFGKELKKLRKSIGITSQVLSNKVNKAVTYVSQLERGLIKNPDFYSCYLLLKELGVKEDKIEDILYNYGIVSPEREKSDLEWNIQQAELKQEEISLDPDSYGHRQYEENLHFWLESTSFELKQLNQSLYNTFNILIDKDVSKAEKVISNLELLTKEKKKFDFLCSLLEYDYSTLKPSCRGQLLSLIAEFMNKSQNDKEVKQ